MTKAEEWWNNLSREKKMKLSDKHCWSTPEKMSKESIEFIYKEENYGY